MTLQTRSGRCRKAFFQGFGKEDRQGEEDDYIKGFYNLSLEIGLDD